MNDQETTTTISKLKKGVFFKFNGQVFYSKWLVNQGTRNDVPTGEMLPITIVSIDVEANVMVVDWASGAGDETWNLQHVLQAFQRNEYTFLPPAYARPTVVESPAYDAAAAAKAALAEAKADSVALRRYLLYGNDTPPISQYTIEMPKGGIYQVGYEKPTTIKRTTPKLQRNGICTCGCGKKNKHCSKNKK
jgi:hypothetical protein